MKNTNKKKDSENESAVKLFFESIGKYVKKDYQFLLLFLFGFIAVSALNFINVSTTQTVANFRLSDFEIGQISDRTIIAEKTLPPDQTDPVSVTEGEKIIKKGFAITEESYAKLKKMSESPLYIDYRAFANSELFLFLLGVMWFLLFYFVPFGRKIQLKEPVFYVVCFIIVYAFTVFCGKLSIFSNPYSVCIIIPATLCVILITILYGNLAAVLMSFILSFDVLLASGYELATFIYTLSSSLFSAAIVRKIDKRLDLVLGSTMIALFNIVLMLFDYVIFNELLSGIGKIFIGISINGFFSGILALGLLTPLEYLLNTASVFRLMDLCDLHTPLMEKMQIQASGTYSHSMMVATLADTACKEIKANNLLARVGAYYHDIGKIDQSEYFVENQSGKNLHDDLNPTLSCSIIKSHVKKGVEKAYQMHLPQSVIDIIAQHHGNSVITFFYNEGKEKDATLSPEDFSYPGVPPTTRESAVVMLADTVEAACHTLQNPSVPRLEKFITVLINSKVEHGQLDNCDLTYTDISKIKKAFVQVLAGYYHSRIEYPDQVDPGKEDKQDKTEKTVQTKTEKDEKAKNEK